MSVTVLAPACLFLAGCQSSDVDQPPPDRSARLHHYSLTRDHPRSAETRHSGRYSRKASPPPARGPRWCPSADYR